MQKIQGAIGPYEGILTTVEKRKLRWFGHVIRSSGLCKKIVQDTVPGKRKRGRQKKRWEDNIGEWTCLDFNSSQRAAEDRQRWQKSIADVNSGVHTTLMVPGHRKEQERLISASSLKGLYRGSDYLVEYFGTRSRIR